MIPLPIPKLRPNAASQPPPHTQWAKSGKIQPPRNAAEITAPRKDQRSSPAPRGMMAASEQPNRPNAAVNSGSGASGFKPPKKNRPAPIQFHSFPPAFS